MTTKQCTKERHAIAKLFFNYFKAIIVFLRFSLPSPSWDSTFSNLQLFRERLSEKLCTRQSRKVLWVIWDMINTLFPGLWLSNLLLSLFFSTPKHMSMTSRANLSNFFFLRTVNSKTHNTSRDCPVHFFRQPFWK